MKVRLLQEFGGYPIGAEIGVSGRRGRLMTEAGMCEVISDPEGAGAEAEAKAKAEAEAKAKAEAKAEAENEKESEMKSNQEPGKTKSENAGSKKTKGAEKADKK